MNFIIYDLEASCWRGHPPNGVQEVIEIGALKLNNYGEILGVFSKFIKPDVNTTLSYFCMELTTITQNDVNRADRFPVVIEQFQDWIDIYSADYVLCSWGKFDKVMLSNDCELHDLDIDWLEPHINLKAQYHNYKSSDKLRGLANSLKKEGMDFEGTHHRAIDDAKNLAKIFIKYMDIWQY